MCESDVCCNKWMHRYHAGVPITHYKLLEQSPDPFRCYLCTKLKHATVVEEIEKRDCQPQLKLLSFVQRYNRHLRAALLTKCKLCMALCKLRTADCGLEWYAMETDECRTERRLTRKTQQSANESPQTNAERSERRTDSAPVKKDARSSANGKAAD